MTIGTAIAKLITREAEVTEIAQLSERFRLITLQGRDLQRVWAPGDIVQIAIRGLQHRAYTPLVWNASAGSTTFLAYLHGRGLASDWAASLSVGDRCHFFGPKPAAALPRPGLVFGDETSFGTAAALGGDAEVIFEVTSIAESRAVLDAIHVRDAILVERQPDRAHYAELEQLVRGRFSANQELHGLFTGEAASIQHLSKAIDKNRVKNVWYWAVGKRGHSHF